MENIIECPDAPLEPPFHPLQRKLSQLALMEEDRDDFAAFARERTEFFDEVFQQTLAVLNTLILQEKANLAAFLP